MLNGRGGLESNSMIAILFAMVETRYAAMDFAPGMATKGVAVQGVPKINATRLRSQRSCGTVGSGGRRRDVWYPLGIRLPKRPFRQQVSEGRRHSIRLRDNDFRSGISVRLRIPLCCLRSRL